MYLSQLILNPRSRLARRDLADRFELHRTILAAFPETLPEDERVLFRVEQYRSSPTVPVLVQSRTIPDWQQVDRLDDTHYLVDEPLVRPVAMQVQAGQVIPFRLQANPTVKRDGKRHAIYAEDDLLAWLNRKGDQNGFTVDPLDIRARKLGRVLGKNRQRTWHAVQFDGRLQVQDVTTFGKALNNGIGSAKAFGFGLLSIPYGTVE